jgi:acyl-CoA dehydrogenase
VGRARGDALADHPGGREDRPLRLRGARQFWADPTGLTLPIVNEELFWGDAGIGMAIMGTSLAVAGIFSSGTPEQMGEWVPQCYGTPDDPKVAAFCVSEPDAGSDVSSLRTRAKYDEAKDEWVLNGQKAWATNGGIAERPRRRRVGRPRARLARPGRVRHPAEHAGLRAGHEGQEARPARVAHRGRLLRRLPHPGLVPARRQGEARRAPRPRPRGQARQRSQAAMQTFEASRPTVGAQADRHRPRAYEYSLGYAKERVQFGKPIIENQAIAFTLADMKLEIDAPACSSGARRGWARPATASRTPRAR